MRQHPIPQNVLDVEFKLFTKFTLKEFAYLALGIGTGGIFLYLSIRGDIPGIIGIPIFLVLSLIGIFLALVPINDQPADKAIINFFTAINRPTQRVWLNEALKEQRLKPIVSPTEQSKSKIIGGSVSKGNSNQQLFTESPGDDILATEKNNTITDIQETKSEITLPYEKYITISDENISKYQFQIKSIDKLPGNINIWLCTKENQPLSNINTYLKDSDGKILYANKTGPNGYFLSNKIYPEGLYILEFENVGRETPKLRISLSKNFSKLPLKIVLK